MEKETYSLLLQHLDPQLLKLQSQQLPDQQQPLKLLLELQLQLPQGPLQLKRPQQQEQGLLLPQLHLSQLQQNPLPPQLPQLLHQVQLQAEMIK